MTYLRLESDHEITIENELNASGSSDHGSSNKLGPNAPVAVDLWLFPKG